MGLLTFRINVTLDGCVDHREGIAGDETHAFFTSLMNEGGAMLWGRDTYEKMESDWPAVARGEVDAPPAIREWVVQRSLKGRPEGEAWLREAPLGMCGPRMAPGEEWILFLDASQTLRPCSFQIRIRSDRERQILERLVRVQATAGPPPQ